MRFLGTLIILITLIGCNKASKQDAGIAVRSSETKCESLDQYEYIDGLIELSGSLDSILAVIDNAYLPDLIKIQHTCPEYFDNLSLKVLLRCHKEEVDKGYSDGVLISKKAFDSLCLLLFQSNYMKQAQNYGSSSRTKEIYEWAKRNTDKLNDYNREYLLSIVNE